MDDNPNLTIKRVVDIQISIAQLDRLGNAVYSNRNIVTDIPLEKGLNRIPMNIHNYKGDNCSQYEVKSDGLPATTVITN
jgi:hypothetical protein